MIKIRKFELSDLPAVMEIEKISFPKTQAYPRSYFQKYYQKYPESFIVVETQGEIVGYAISRFKEDLGEFISLAVKPKFRRKGIGANLTKFLIEHFQKKNIKKVFLHVRARNKKAVSFYKNLGFEILKKIENYYRNSDDAYLMKKEN